MNQGHRVNGMRMGFSAIPNTMVLPGVFVIAEYDFQKLPGMPPRADLNSVSMPSVLDCRAEKRSSWRMGTLCMITWRQSTGSASGIRQIKCEQIINRACAALHITSVIIVSRIIRRTLNVPLNNVIYVHILNNRLDVSSIEGNAIFRQDLIYLFQGQSFGGGHVIDIIEVTQDIAFHDFLLDGVLPIVDNDGLKGF